MEKSSIKFYIAYTLFSAAIAVVAALVAYAVYVVAPFKKNVDFTVRGDWFMVNDEAIGFTAAKNAALERTAPGGGISYHVYTDSRGIRVSAKGAATPDKVALVSVGCSFTWGHGLENDDTFTAMLGKSLGVPVANLAMAGYGTVQSVQILERNLDLAPKVIVYGFITDHFRRNLSPCATFYTPWCVADSYVAFDQQGAPYIHAPHMQYSQEETRKFLQDVAPGGFGIRDIFWGLRIARFRLTARDLMFPAIDEARCRKSTNLLMDRLQAAARKSGAALIVVYLPYMDKGHAEPPPPELLDSLGRDTILVDMYPVIKAYYDDPRNPDLRLNDHDPHPNRRANALIAAELEKVIRGRHLLDRVR